MFVNSKLCYNEIVLFYDGFMKAILLICACWVACNSVKAQNFFDYSNEQAMLERFKDFETRKCSFIRQLAKYGVFEKRVDQENMVQAKSSAQRLWLDITQRSVPFGKLNIEKEDCDKVIAHSGGFVAITKPFRSRAS